MYEHRLHGSGCRGDWSSMESVPDSSDFTHRTHRILNVIYLDIFFHNKAILLGETLSPPLLPCKEV